MENEERLAMVEFKNAIERQAAALERIAAAVENLFVLLTVETDEDV
jgi:hypothetical protein